MATYQLKFGTYDFSELIEAQDETIPNRLNAQQVPKRHGVLITEVPVLGARTIRLRGRVFGADGPTTRQTVRDIENALGTTRQKLYYFSDRFFYAYKSNFQWSFVEGSALCVANIAIEFICDDPFEYDDTVPSPSNRIITNADIPVDITNNIYKEAFTINWSGTGFAYITSTVTADQGSAVTYSIIRNLTTGRNNQYTGTLNIGKALVIDNGAFTVLNDGVNDLKNWNGSWLYLVNGVNSMEVEGNPASYSISYLNRYY